MRSLVLLALLFGAGDRAGAQSETGAIRGAVTDTAGAPLQGARVRISGTSLHSETDGEGRFTLAHVRPGRYEVRVTRIGYKAEVDSAVVLTSATLDMRFTLREAPHEVLKDIVERASADDTQPR